MWSTQYICQDEPGRIHAQDSGYAPNSVCPGKYTYIDKESSS